MPKGSRSVSNERQPAVLALLNDRRPMQSLLQQLQGLGHQVDTADDLAGCRAAFFGSGGHDCLVVGPDVAPGLTQQVLRSLRAIDPALALATFAPRPAATRALAPAATLGQFHPGSRAGAGALLRFLKALRLR
jgi:hypothetical protein